MKRFLIIIICALSTFGAIAQDLAKPDSIKNVDKDMILEKFLLPDLDECIQSAIKNSPLLKASDVEVEKLLEEIKIKKKSWLDYVQIDANSRYGLFNQLSLTEQTGDAPDIAIQSNKEQLNYFAGVTIRMPFSYFANNKNEQKILKHSIRESELRKEELKNEISRMVITEYFKLKNLYEMLGFHQNNLQTAQIDFMKAKSEVKGSMLGMTEFAAITTAYTKAVDAFISTKNEYYSQFYMLKILTGSNLQKIVK